MKTWKEFYKYSAFLALLVLLSVTFKYNTLWSGFISGLDIFCIWLLLRSDKN